MSAAKGKRFFFMSLFCVKSLSDIYKNKKCDIINVHPNHILIKEEKTSELSRLFLKIAARIVER